MNLSQISEKMQNNISTFQRRQRNKQDYIVKLGHQYFQEIKASRFGVYAEWTESQLQAASLNRKEAQDYAAYLEADIYCFDDEGYECLVKAYRKPEEKPKETIVAQAEGWTFITDERLKELHDIEREYYRMKNELNRFIQSLRGEQS